MYHDSPPDINSQRLWQSHLDMAQIGALPGGGCCRLALSDEDRRARDLLVRWCREIGCRISVDEAGNIFARRGGTLGHLAPVACGSHLDTQPHGGRFDGIYGVLGGLEVLRTVADHNIRTERALELIVWTNEEGVRFSPGLMGSAVFAGRLPIDRLLQTLATDGESLHRHSNASDLGHRNYGRPQLDSFFELHIEQGPILESNKTTIGVVAGCSGYLLAGNRGRRPRQPRRNDSLNMRRDALLAQRG